MYRDQETDRYSIDARVDERTLREVYLEPFRLAVRDGDPWAAMSAYNWIGGTAASERAWSVSSSRPSSSSSAVYSR